MSERISLPSTKLRTHTERAVTGTCSTLSAFTFIQMGHWLFTCNGLTSFVVESLVFCIDSLAQGVLLTQDVAAFEARPWAQSGIWQLTRARHPSAGVSTTGRPNVVEMPLPPIKVRS